MSGGIWGLQAPFQPGETWYKGATIDSNNLSGVEYEGRVFEFPDLDYSQSSPYPHRSSATVKRKIVRNVAGFAVLPKRLVTPRASGTDFLGQVDGYAETTAELCYPVDEFVAAAGVPDDDLFYIVIEGPATVLLPLAGSEFNGDVSVGSILVSLTAATSGATTAGRAAVQNITGSSQATDYSFIHNNVQNMVGRALSAATTGNTNTDLLVNIGKL